MSFNTSSMKKIFAFLLFGCLYASSFGQVFTKDTIAPNTKFSIGFYPVLLYYEEKVDDPNMKFARIFSCECRPYISYRIIQNLYVGGAFSYEFYKSNFYTKDKLIELGVFSRYYVPFIINKRFFKNFRVYGEFAYNKTNYKVVPYVANVVEFKNITIEEDYIIYNSLNQNKITIPIGIEFPITKKLKLDFNWQYSKYIQGTHITGFMSGVSYNF